MQNSDDYNAEDLEDLKNAIGLLAGSTKRDKKNLPTKKYLKGEGENGPRKAIARLLRNSKPLDSALRMQLAALFDPDPETAPFSTFDNSPIERKIVFEYRNRGRPREDLRQLAIAYEAFEIWKKLPERRRKMVGIIRELTAKYNISEPYVRKAIKSHKNLFR